MQLATFPAFSVLGAIGSVTVVLSAPS